MAEKLNGPGFGFRMQAAGQPVSLAQVGQLAAARMVERERQLHELLAHCEQNDPGEGFKLTGEEQAYHDIAVRLRKILDAPK